MTRKKRNYLILSGLGLLAALVVVASTLGVAGASENQPVLPGLTPEKLTVLRERAITGATEMGDAHPTNALVLATTQHAFFRALHGASDFGGNDFDVYVVAYQGNFSAGMASTPAGVPPPKGHFVYAVLNATTLDVTDWGILQSPIDISAFGPSIPLDLGS